MKGICCLITGAGAPGTIGTLYSLKKTKRQIRTIGVDINGDAVGQYLCDAFYQVPRPSEDCFVGRILEICEKEHVDVVLPQVNEELLKLSPFRYNSVKIAISDTEVINAVNDKSLLMYYAKMAGVPTPEYHVVETFTQLEQSLFKLGYPEKKVVVKPPVSRGMIGLRIVDDSLDRKKAFFTEKPEHSIYVKRQELNFLGEKFPPLIAMEYLPGKEYSVDVLSKKNKAVVVVPRTRDLMRTGITFTGTTEKNDEIIRYSKKLTEKMGLEYAHGYQFKLDDEGKPRLIECNPRIQGTMVLSTFAGANIIYGAVQLALGEKPPKYSVKWGTRLFRDWGAIGVLDNEVIENS